MSTPLPPHLASYVAALNAHDPDAFAAHFASDAIVHDEGHEHRGVAAIRQWIVEANRKYQFTMEVTGLRESAGETILSGLVSGTFPGSPVELHHQITLQDAKIQSLRITS